MQESQRTGGSELQKFFDPVHITEREGIIAAFFDFFLKSEREADGIFDCSFLRGTYKIPIIFDFCSERINFILRNIFDQLIDFQKVKMFNLSTDLFLQQIAIIQSTIQAHIPITAHADKRMFHHGRSRGGTQIRNGFLITGCGIFEVDQILEIISHFFHGSTQSGGTGLIGSGNKVSIFPPSAEPPEEHGFVFERFNDLDHRPSGNPPGNTNNQSIKITF